MNKWLLVIFALAVAGCSNKNIYDNLRLDERYGCSTAPSASYFDCVERTEKSYKEYERERQAVLQ